MTLEDLGNIGEFVGAIGVVVSLLYLAVQIRQNTKSVRASTHHDSIVAGNVVQMAFADTDVARIVIGAGKSYSDLTLEEKFTFTMLMRAFFSWQEDTYLQFQEGLLTRERWESAMRALTEVLARRGISDWWKRNQHVYSTRFQHAVAESCLQGREDR